MTQSESRKTRTAVIIQARMGSTRLAGKVLRQLCGQSILAHVVSRVSRARGIDDIVIATTDQPQDDSIAAEAARLGTKACRGSESDVLARYHKAAVEAEAGVIVRVTSDCPFYDPGVLTEMLDAYRRMRGKVDYLSNTLERTYPRGLDTEIFTFAALEESFREARLPAEREHVTPYIYGHPGRFRLRNYRGDQDRSSERWTLDTEEDWRFVEAVYTRLYPKNPTFSTQDVLAVLDAEPALRQYNAHVEQKSI